MRFKDLEVVIEMIFVMLEMCIGSGNDVNFQNCRHNNRSNLMDDNRNFRCRNEFPKR